MSDNTLWPIIDTVPYILSGLIVLKCISYTIAGSNIFDAYSCSAFSKVVGNSSKTLGYS